jgi:hypothetical protein
LLEVERLPLVECARCKGSGRIWPNDSDSKECPSRMPACGRYHENYFMIYYILISNG